MPPVPHRSLLDLRPDNSLDARIGQTLEREFDAFDATLADWGRFTAPVIVRSTTDRAAFQAAAAGAATDTLCAVAGLHGLLVLAPNSWHEPPAAAPLAAVLLHELAHVLLFQRSTPPNQIGPAYVPTWFREGMATVIAEGPPAPRERRLIADHPHLLDLPNADGALLSADPGACYLTASLLFEAWMQGFGMRRFHALCRAMRAGHGFDGAHAAATATTASQWVSTWLAGVRREAAQT